jgi:hypothetical protein
VSGRPPEGRSPGHGTTAKIPAIEWLRVRAAKYRHGEWSLSDPFPGKAGEKEYLPNGIPIRCSTKCRNQNAIHRPAARVAGSAASCQCAVPKTERSEADLAGRGISRAVPGIGLKYSIIRSMSERSDSSGWSKGKPTEISFLRTEAEGWISLIQRTLATN